MITSPNPTASTVSSTCSHSSWRITWRCVRTQVHSIHGCPAINIPINLVRIPTTAAEIGLVGYTLLVLLRNLLAGLEAVPEDVREAAVGMGFGRWRLFTRVELPLALPALFAGIRVATGTTIGLVTVTVLIGEGGLGQMLYDGFERGNFRTEELVATVLVVLLALVADLVLVGVERLLTPWAHRVAA